MEVMLATTRGATTACRWRPVVCKRAAPSSDVAISLVQDPSGRQGVFEMDSDAELVWAKMSKTAANKDRIENIEI